MKANGAHTKLVATVITKSMDCLSVFGVGKVPAGDLLGGIPRDGIIGGEETRPPAYAPTD